MLTKMVEPSVGPIFTVVEDPEDWLIDFELWLLSMHMLTDVKKLQTVPLLMQGQAKLWFNGLKSSDQGSWVDELLNKKELHIEVNQGAKMIADVGVRVQLKEIKPILVESFHERVAKCNQQQVDKGAVVELVYGADDDEDTSLSCWETSEEDRADESTSYGNEIEPDKPELRTEQANVHGEDQVEQSRPTVVQQVQRFAKKNRAIMPIGEDKDDAIESEFLSSLTEYVVAGEKMLEEQVAKADTQVVLIDLEGPVNKEELEDARINCMAGKEESREPKVELPVLQVCSMIGSGDSQVGVKPLKEVQDFLEENFTLYGWEGGHDMFSVNDVVHSEIGDAFGGVFLEMGNLPTDLESNESMLMAAYVDNWLDAQVWHYDKVLQVDVSDQSQMFDPGGNQVVIQGVEQPT
ncbi:hypothetical protein L7F22_014248 [Adiantum nelumboides]|nr:hypothetical protein [Adiantum nelumboides]